MNRQLFATSYTPAPNKNYRYVPIQTKRQEEPTERPANITKSVIMRSDKHAQRQLQQLRKANEELRQREDVYIDKLMKLQQGLQNQHNQFIKLQQLYTQLFECYKKKEVQITQLQHKYRQSSRSNNQSNQLRPSTQKYSSKQNQRWSSKQNPISRQKAYTLKQSQWLTKQRQWKLRQNELISLNQNLTQKLLTINEKYQKNILNQMNSNNQQKYVVKHVQQEKLIADIEEWQARFQSEKEFRVKLQYQNQFLRNRNQDLEDQRVQFQQLITYKQKEIAKLRSQKIKIHRETSQKIISRSPSRSSRTALRNASPAQFTHTASPVQLTHDSKQQQSRPEQQSSRMSSNPPHNLQKYFSFSRQKKNEQIQQSLPAFPPQLEIDSLINEHRH